MVEEVLIIGTPIHSYTDSVNGAFIRNKIKSNYLIYKKPNKYLKKIPFISRLYYFWYYNIYPQSFYKYCLKNCPENCILILFGISYLTNEQLQCIKREKKIRIVSWFIDSIYTYSWFNKNIEESDYILCYNKTESDRLSEEGKRAVFFPMAYDQSYYYPIKDSAKEYDLYFIGTLSKRLEFFEELLIRLKPLNLRIRIDGPVSLIRRIKLRKKYPLLNKHLSGLGAEHRKINELYNKSYICLGLQPAQADTGFSTRTYEICGSGALQLTNGNKELLNNLLEIDSEILHFDCMDELIARVDYAIANKGSKAFSEISAKGYRRALNDHTFDKRVKQLLAFIENGY